MSSPQSGNDPVIVIGTGLGGASLAWKLASLGRSVMLLEQGAHLKRTPRTASPGAFIVDVHGPRDKPIEYLGGQTKFYGAALYRFRESDFKEVEHEGGVSPGWPFGYSELEPYYEEAERLYKVHGSSGGDTSEPPRRHDYPYPPIEHAPLVDRLIARLHRAGIEVAPIPRGLDRGPGRACSLCAGCDAHVCTIDAKMDAEIAAIRPALATGRVQLLTNTRALRIVLDGSSRQVRGVQVLRDGREELIPGRTVAVCAGLPGSAKLLRRSACPAHPEGLGGSSGALGKYLAGHSTGMIFPIMGLRTIPPTHTKTFAINQYYDRSPGCEYPTGVIQVAGQMPFWDEASRRIRAIVRFIGKRSLMCFYMSEALPTPDSGLVFEGAEVSGRVEPIHNLKTFKHLRRLAVDAFRKAGHVSLARVRAPYLWHEVGTARMGEDPATSVVDPNLQVHGVEGLFVVDASVLCSAGSVNTGLTIIALALRAGVHIASST